MSQLAERLTPLVRFRRPADIALLARVVAVGASVPLLVRLPLPRLAAVLSWATGGGGTAGTGASEHDAARMAACVDAAQRAGSPLVRSGCLTRAVTLYVLLRRASMPVELCFGVGRLGDGGAIPGGTGHGWAGHCWLVRDGQPYLEPGGSPARFDEVYRIPPPRP